MNRRYSDLHCLKEILTDGIFDYWLLICLLVIDWFPIFYRYLCEWSN